MQQALALAPQVARFPLGARLQPPATEELSPALDDLSLQFAIWARTAARPSLDIGCGDGVATAAVLARGGRVVAVDPNPTSIRRLMTRVPCEQHPRLKTLVGSLPDVDFKLAPFGAVHAARVLHLLDGADLDASVRKFFRWLYPHGKLFISIPASRDEWVLRRKLEAVGFAIESVSRYPLPWDGEQLCCAIVAKCAFS